MGMFSKADCVLLLQGIMAREFLLAFRTTHQFMILAQYFHPLHLKLLLFLSQCLSPNEKITVFLSSILSYVPILKN